MECIVVSGTLLSSTAVDILLAANCLGAQHLADSAPTSLQAPDCAAINRQGCCLVGQMFF